MIWAKIVNDEIMQTHDENPAGLWHPDAIDKNDLPGYWEEVPEHVNVGWKFKNRQWISGGQWMEEQAAETTIPVPGPPGVRIDFTPCEDRSSAEHIVIFDSIVTGIYDTWSITIGETTYSAIVTATNGETNELTCATTEWLADGDQVTFMGTMSGVAKHQMYEVTSVINATKFKIRDPIQPLQTIELTTDTGTMMMSKGPDFTQTFQKIDAPQTLALSITATGPGGPITYIAEGELALIIPEKWVPLFARP